MGRLDEGLAQSGEAARLDLGLHQARADPVPSKEMQGSFCADRDRGTQDCGRRWALVTISTYATCGDIARARQKLSEMHAIEANRYVDPTTFAGVHASLGELEEALRCLIDRRVAVGYVPRKDVDMTQLQKTSHQT
jgi:hypothetical protein